MVRAKVGEIRTVVPKKGVFIHVKKKPSGKFKALRIRRTKARVRRTGKPRVELIRTYRRRVRRTRRRGRR